MSDCRIVLPPPSVVTHFHEFRRFGVLAVSEQKQMCVLCNFNLILLALLPLALQITKFTAMIFVIYEPPIVLCRGTQKTVSYVKYFDASRIVSASTYNSLKLWDMSRSPGRDVDNPIQTYTGHTNTKVRYPVRLLFYYWHTHILFRSYYHTFLMNRVITMCRSGFTTLPPVPLQEQPAVVLLLEGLRSHKVLVIREYGGHEDLRGSGRRSVIPYVHG
jgi:hypothetical protein